MTEQQLIENCIRGNGAAQQMLYEKYSPRLYGVCLRYARNSAEAQDILQDSFIRIFRYLPQYGGKGSLEGWMRKIVVNVALRMIQVSFSRYELPVESLPESAEDAEILPQLHAQELLQLIQKLPDGYRVVFNMFALEGFSHAEIAAELGVNESTSRSQLTKARKLLQKWVEVHFGMDKTTNLRIAK